jgi:ribosomal protein S18 acetylase RimI-like enzyme
MVHCVEHPFSKKGRFTVPAARTALPRCDIRPVDDTDFATCAAIYRLNGTDQLPPAYSKYFLEWLHTRQAQVFVAEVNGQVRGFGGINLHQQHNMRVATLAFGTVHPAYHRQGFGTALLLGRLATLPDADSNWELYAITTTAPDTFYQQFGFSWIGRFPRHDGPEFDLHQALFDKACQKTCHSVLRAASILLVPSSVASAPLTSAN